MDEENNQEEPLPAPPTETTAPSEPDHGLAPRPAGQEESTSEDEKTSEEDQSTPVDE